MYVSSFCKLMRINVFLFSQQILFGLFNPPHAGAGLHVREDVKDMIFISNSRRVGRLTTTLPLAVLELI